MRDKSKADFGEVWGVVVFDGAVRRALFTTFSKAAAWNIARAEYRAGGPDRHVLVYRVYHVPGTVDVRRTVGRIPTLRRRARKGGC